MRLTTIASKLPADGKWLPQDEFDKKLAEILDPEPGDRAIFAQTRAGLVGAGLIERSGHENILWRRTGVTS